MYIFMEGFDMKQYEINKNTYAIIYLGLDKSLVIEKNDQFEVNLSTTKIVDKSCKFFGSSYLGRLKGTKEILGISYKAPIIIEESNPIIFFPTLSPRVEGCSWISLNNLEDYYATDKKSIVNFSCGKQLPIDIQYNILDNQVLRATRLESLLNKRIKNALNC